MPNPGSDLSSERCPGGMVRPETSMALGRAPSPATRRPDENRVPIPRARSFVILLPIVHQIAHQTDPPANDASPLWACVSLTWLASAGTGLGWSGIFFIAEQAYGFGRSQNLILGAVMGAVYVIGALGAGRFVRSFTRSERFSERGTLIAVCALMAIVSLVPALTESTIGLWVFAGLYIALSGVLWPLVESFVSGGRAGARLRKATGLFNISWSSAMIVSMLGIAPILKDSPRSAFIGLAAAHLLCGVIALRLLPAAGKHGEAGHGHSESELARCRSLLRVFRIGLFTSYVLHSSLVPMLPALLERLGVEVAFKAVLASAWMFSRFLVFLVMERSEWWHGKWFTPVFACVLMAIGFVWTHLLGAGAMPGGSRAMIASLSVLGLGIGAMYAGAIYYAMEAGGADARDGAHIEAGGVHESMIGLGYTIGPLLALLVLLWL